MSAYATNQSQLRALPSLKGKDAMTMAAATESSLIESLVSQLAERVAAVVVDRLSSSDERGDEWLDSRYAAEYLGVHRERAIPSEQDGPGCKLYFRRSDLDAWRHGGGRPRHLADAVRQAA